MTYCRWCQWRVLRCDEPGCEASARSEWGQAPEGWQLVGGDWGEVYCSAHRKQEDS